MNKIYFNKEQVYELIENAVDRESDTSYRHGSYETFIVLYEGKFYSMTFTCSPNEGLDVYDETEAVEVEKVEVVTTDWRVVK